MSRLDLSRPGAWRKLLPQALRLMEHLERETRDPPWTLGGGTVLMLRLGHRLSKDIDLFVPDPQYLGYVNPRLSDVAEAVTSDYEENAEYLKLFLRVGEIDIVVGQALTPGPFEVVKYKDRTIRAETNAEIIAKKMWHRGDRAKARDLFDLCAVEQADPAAIRTAMPWMGRHAAQFLAQMKQRATVLKRDFEAIESLDFKESFEHCVARAAAVLEPAVRSGSSGRRSRPSSSP